MKKFLLTFSTLLIISFCFSQIPAVKWTKYYYTAGFDNISETFFDAKSTSDSGFILAGSDTAYTYNKEEYLKKYIQGRPWLVKTDRDGNVLWRITSQDVYPHTSSFTAVQVVSTGGIIAVGYGKPSNPEPVKYFIAKYNDNGTQLWFKKYGGVTGISRAYGVQETADGGYIVAGNTTSNDGDVTGNHNAGTSDIWLLKLNSSGNISWQKCFGGSGNDSAYAVIESPDHGFVIAGVSSSSNGDLTGNNGLSDAWVFKVNSSGTLIWQKNIGGTGHEDFKDITLNSDSTYTLTGFTLSSSATTNGNHGKRDLWVIRVDGSGQTIWSKSFGGSQDEQGYSIQKTIGNGYLISGYTESSDGDVTVNNGLADAWLLNLNFDGSLNWEKTVGNSKDNFAMQGLFLSETDFAIAGYSKPIVPAASFDSTDAMLSRLGNANTIKGILFFDTNLNGVYNAGETMFNEALVTAQKTGAQTSAVPDNGLFTIPADTGAYSTSVHVNLPYYTATPASVNSTFTSYFNTDSFSFAIQPIPGMRDLVVHLVPLTLARPGFPVTYKIYYKNVGTDTVSSGQVLFRRDSRLNFVSATPAISSSNGDTLKWNFSNFRPFDTASILINLQLSPSAHVGDTLFSTAIITPIVGDQTPSDDTSNVRQVIDASYDPNDKYENNEGTITSSFVAAGKYLDYLVRFQNIGTDTAFDIVVRDTLSSKLDWSSFQMIGASHSYQLTIKSQNQLQWTFNNIDLPDSNVNEPASHGYIAYRIKPKTNLVEGDTIHNTASIYFDFNLPVRTNDAYTVVRDNLAPLPLRLLSFSGVYKNDIGNLYWATSNEINVRKFEIERSTTGGNFIFVGQIAAANSFSGSSYQFQDNLTNVSGDRFYYRLKEIDNDGRIKYSRTILLYRKNISQPAVYPNPADQSLTLHISSASTQPVTISIADVNGKILLKENKIIIAGNNSMQINNLQSLVSGSYFVLFQYGSDHFSLPLVVFHK